MSAMVMAPIPMERDWIDEARRRQAGSVAADRFGRPGKFGTAEAFLCGVQAGYISGEPSPRWRLRGTGVR
jgi:NAD(P)-dependent dehydrogenase (short-subunit alcohol dehydrogenase family)